MLLLLRKPSRFQNATIYAIPKPPAAAVASNHSGFDLACLACVFGLDGARCACVARACVRCACGVGAL